jgi:hypothetical protein
MREPEGSKAPNQENPRNTLVKRPRLRPWQCRGRGFESHTFTRP